MKSVVRKCPVCASKRGDILHTQKFILPERYPLPNSYDIVECEHCGFVYADTSASQKDYDHYYEEFSKYEDKVTASGGGDKHYDAQRLERTASDIEKVISNKSATILDVGCGNGGLLLALKRKGYNNLFGLDPSATCVTNVKELGIHAVKGGIFSSKLNQQFDFIILSHVLEHVYDLQEAMENVNSWLKVGGILYIEVPDAQRYADQYIVPYYYFDIEHINHFDEQSINNLISSHDLILINSNAKEFPVSDSIVYPAFYAFCRKIDYRKAAEKMIISKSNVKESVVRYIALSRTNDKWPELQELSESQEGIIVWGAGSYTQRLLENSFLGQCNIIAFIDRDSKKQGLLLKNTRVHSPDFLKGHQEPIVVCAALFSDEIVGEIHEMGLQNRIIVLH
jgi:SAM-dependent methyltransferase